MWLKKQFLKISIIFESKTKLFRFLVQKEQFEAKYILFIFYDKNNKSSLVKQILTTALFCQTMNQIILPE